MKDSLSAGARLSTAPLIIALAGIVAMAMVAYHQLVRLDVGVAHAPRVVTARLAPGTEGLLQQTAEHLSKMQGGDSIGGFPGFEPPGDDEKYRRKIKDRDYNPQDVNDWVKEINNFLRQITNKNRGLTLEVILQRQGLNRGQIDSFINTLRDTQATAAGMEGHGVSEATAKTLEALMKVLGVSTW